MLDQTEGVSASHRLDPIEALALEVEVPAHLEGEPTRGPLPPLRFAFRVLLRSAGVAVWVLPSLSLWLLYGLAAQIYGRAPNMVRVDQVLRYLGDTWTVDASEAELPVHHRVWLSLCILLRLELAPLRGLAWLLDEALYAPALDAREVRAPLIALSAARSGSTQIARYLERDPQLVAPSMLQFMLPYLWLWRLGARLAVWIPPAFVAARIEAAMWPEFLERHEADVFRTDTFDAALYSATLNPLSFFLGPRLIAREANLAEAAPHNRVMWERDFVELFDRIGRKLLLWHGPDTGPRVFIKGHFLAAADALERRYPDARFLTVVRPPRSRVRSTINYIRTTPLDFVLGPPAWRPLALGLALTEARYSELEQAWYSRTTGARRCVLRFEDYVADLEASMAKIYRECLDMDELPAHVPREHAPRERKRYAIDRSLTRVGIDADALEARLAAYIGWLGDHEPTQSSGLSDARAIPSDSFCP